MKSRFSFTRSAPFMLAMVAAIGCAYAWSAHSALAKNSQLVAVSPVTSARLKALVKAQAGHVVLVNFWATWCPPCVAELPALARLQRANSRRGLKMMMVSADAPGSQQAVKSTMKKNGFGSSYLVQGHPEEFMAGFDSSVNGQIAIPLTYIYNKKGHLVKRLSGGHSTLQYQKALNPYLK